MSKISRFFKGGGGSAAHKSRGGPTPQEALARLRETEEMLSKKQEYLESRIERELAAARQHGTKNKRGEGAPALRSHLGALRGFKSWVSRASRRCSARQGGHGVGAERWGCG